MFERLSKKEFLLLLAGLLYLISPVDALPEILAGPLGLADDGAVIAALTAMLLAARNRPQPATVKTNSTVI